jgi:hypothetical protein
VDLPSCIAIDQAFGNVQDDARKAQFQKDTNAADRDMIAGMDNYLQAGITPF